MFEEYCPLPMLEHYHAWLLAEAVILGFSCKGLGERRPLPGSDLGPIEVATGRRLGLNPRHCDFASVF
jgi:hypothetical protein